MSLEIKILETKEEINVTVAGSVILNENSIGEWTLYGVIKTDDLEFEIDCLDWEEEPDLPAVAIVELEEDIKDYVLNKFFTSNLFNTLLQADKDKTKVGAP